MKSEIWEPVTDLVDLAEAHARMIHGDAGVKIEVLERKCDELEKRLDKIDINDGRNLFVLIFVIIISTVSLLIHIL